MTSIVKEVTAAILAQETVDPDDYDLELALDGAAAGFVAALPLRQQGVIEHNIFHAETRDADLMTLLVARSHIRSDRFQSAIGEGA
jgi:hypothetical protein